MALVGPVTPNPDKVPPTKSKVEAVDPVRVATN